MSNSYSLYKVQTPMRGLLEIKPERDNIYKSDTCQVSGIVSVIERN